MKSRDDKIPAYNGQTVIDKKNRMIAVAEIRTEHNDINQLPKNLADLKEQLDIVPGILDADKGYSFSENHKKIQCGKFYSVIIKKLL